MSAIHLFRSNHDETPFLRDETPFLDDETGFLGFLMGGKWVIFGYFLG
jgi:hypothetical protein